jgi:hypothetical protein
MRCSLLASMKTYTMAQIAEQIDTSRQTLYSRIKAGHVAARSQPRQANDRISFEQRPTSNGPRKFVGTSKLGPKKSK